MLMNPFKTAHGLISKHPVKRLAWGVTYDFVADCRCATGVMAFEGGMKFDHYGGLTSTWEDVFHYTAEDVGAWATAQGLTPVDLAIIEHLNDAYSDRQMTEAARYTTVVKALGALGEYDEAQVSALRTAYAATARNLKAQGDFIRARLKELGA